MLRLLPILALFLAFSSGIVFAATNDAPTARSHNPVHRTTTPHTMQLVQITTPVPYEEVTARLYALLGPLNSGKVLPGATSVADLEARVASVVGSSDFMHFVEYNHGSWFQLYNANPTPRFKVYVIGNPLVAETMVRFDLRAAYNVPFRLMILENGNATKIVHQLPSSVIDLSGPEDMRSAAASLDQKLEALVDKMAAVG
ncbi:unnamed protein product [Mycena citricolor]|uniref:DUF302 domain-containing protein n=1 Tax=Mycena citricolor TaxID=2018698 RepID=A0AAD2HWN3_9AGAR|nr:unnamed protein product [Mycena citricolor]